MINHPKLMPTNMGPPRFSASQPPLPKSAQNTPKLEAWQPSYFTLECLAPDSYFKSVLARVSHRLVDPKITLFYGFAPMFFGPLSGALFSYFPPDLVFSYVSLFGNRIKLKPLRAEKKQKKDSARLTELMMFFETFPTVGLNEFVYWSNMYYPEEIFTRSYRFVFRDFRNAGTSTFSTLRSFDSSINKVGGWTNWCAGFQTFCDGGDELCPFEKVLDDCEAWHIWDIMVQFEENMDKIDNYWMTANFGFACDGGLDNILNVMLCYNVSIDVNAGVAHFSGLTGLEMAFSNGRVSTILLLLNKFGADKRSAFNMEKRPTEYAMGWGEETLLIKLCDNGFSMPIGSYGYHCRRSLEKCVRHGHHGMIRLLSKMGKNHYFDQTHLMMAIKERDVTGFLILVEIVNINDKNGIGCNALHSFCGNSVVKCNDFPEHWRAFKYYVDHIYDLWDEDKAGMTPLDVLTKCEETPVRRYVEYLQSKMKQVKVCRPRPQITGKKRSWSQFCDK